jgi:hypothetical protein
VVIKPASSETDIVRLIDGYARKIGPAVLEQHGGNSVCSPLGVWLLLAACVTAASDPQRSALEDALGCPAARAAELLAAFLDAPPSALHTAMALWVRSRDRSTPLVEWSASLPAVIERGPLPSQEVADAWTERATEGLITQAPIQISEDSRVVLTSVLATKVSWEDKFAVEPANEHLRATSSWRGRVERIMVDYQPSPLLMLANTESAGIVAVHFALAKEDLGVLSVAADPGVGRPQVFEAAYELARRCRSDTAGQAKVSLFDLPLGEGASWVISEREVATYEEGARSEEIEYTVLPAWRTESNLDLKHSLLFGAHPALGALLELIGPSPQGDETVAAQSAVASFTPLGFDAAAISMLGIEIGESGSGPTERGLRRRARLYFDHPYAALAVAGTPADFRRARAGHTDLFCLPLFSAWIETPHEPDPPADYGSRWDIP